MIKYVEMQRFDENFKKITWLKAKQFCKKNIGCASE